MSHETIPDQVASCRDKLRFIGEIFTQAKPGEHFILSAEALSGFYYIVSDIEDDLENIYNRLSQPAEI